MIWRARCALSRLTRRRRTDRLVLVVNEVQRIFVEHQPAIYFVAACFCGMALVVAISRSEALGVALVLVEVVVIFLMRSLGRRREARQGWRESAG